MPESSRLLIMSRYPVPGQAKTRLIPALGADGAARLQRRMTEHAVAVARKVRDGAGSPGAGITVCHTGARERAFRAWLGQDLSYSRQRSGDLGQRLQGALEEAFQGGASAAVVLGTDIPGITPELLRRALDDLETCETVLGEAADGGYYLIGMRRLHPELFTGIDWGTERVVGQTRAILDELGLTRAELPILEDVDRPEDLGSIRGDPLFQDLFHRPPRISVIIPALDEADRIGRVLERVRQAEGVEIILVDGGSRDGTREIAARAGAKVLDVTGTRGERQGAGAAAAGGRYLLFLHADTLLPEGWADRIRRTLENPAVVAGAFRFRTEDRRLGLRLIWLTTQFRSSVLRLPYGDQGIFLERRVFQEMGGFADLPIMEDFELVSRLRRRGSVVTLPEAVITSARRWRRLGIFRTALINQVMIVGYLAGVPIERLCRLYRGS